MEFKFDFVGIGQIIKQERFKVPPNQREYSWIAESQVTDLLQDINNALRNPNKPYFLGTVVLTKTETDTWEIADGQQRIATTTMIFAAIRDHFRNIGNAELFRAIETNYLFSYEILHEEKLPHLTLNIDDNEYFKNVVLDNYNNTNKTQTKYSHKLIYSAFNSIKKYIDDIVSLNGNNSKDVLRDWMTYLEKQAKIVMLKVEDSDTAFKLFETLNDRGLKTSQVDLVKNHLFSKSGDRLEEAQNMWSNMKSNIETVTDDDNITIDFLRSVCCIIAGQTTKKDIMDTIRIRTETKTDSLKILSLLLELSQEYAAILNSDHPKWNAYGIDAQKSIQVISLLNLTQVQPLLLAVSKYFGVKHVPGSFKLLVSWSVRFLALNIKGGRVDEGYAKLANKIFIGEIKSFDDLKNQTFMNIVTDAEFKSAFEGIRVGTIKIARYYLRSLEITASGQNDAEFIPNDNTLINLEHIMPLSLDEEHWKNIDKAEASGFIKRLGNMCLLQAKRNSDIGNMSFAIKKEVYKESSYQLTNQLAELDNWNIQDIENRQKVLAELAIKTWAI